jgi:hypothetical protein
MEDPTGTEHLVEPGEVLGRGPVGALRLFFGIEVIEIAEELVEAMDRR